MHKKKTLLFSSEKMVSKVVCLVALLFFCPFITVSTEEADHDAAFMKRLALRLSPTPLGWNISGHHCNWSGISCDISLRVTKIDISNLNVTGTLPTDLNSLSQLTFLFLQYNYLSGSFPSLANLTHLQYIYFYSNNFTSIPDDAFLGLTSLKLLFLDYNPKLRSWTFPTQLVHSRNLTDITASNTNLVGSIPDIFISLPLMKQLDLSFNHLSGSLPPSFSKSSMAYLRLSNQTVGLSGTLDILANMTLLKSVILDGNRFTGPIPDLSLCKSLSVLQVQNNKLQGPLPVFRRGANVSFGGVTGNSFCKDTPGPCDQQVTTLLQVARAVRYPIELAEAWKGNDACSQWRFVQCDPTENVMIINLAGLGLQGNISPAFVNLTYLIELHLNDNNLTGTIPQSLTQLTRLRTLDLSNNNILPPLPRFASYVDLKISGNPFLHMTKRKTFIKIILPTLFGGLVTLITITCIVVKHEKKRRVIKQQKEAQQLENSLQLPPYSPVRFTYEVLKMATNNFDDQRKLGGGGFGSVYEGTLSDGFRVAVKRLEHFSQGKKEFLTEVRTMGGIHHLNMVKLVGFCAEQSNKLLVYEYMSNGSLDKWIFHNNSNRILSWDIRKRIILDTAKGLAYLHEECMMRIAHLDVKPQNVLLDEGFNAKLSDFGLAKLIDRDQSHVMTQMRGTRGYLAPEWLDRKITEKADVYSYGVVVLEVIFQRKNLDGSPPEESDNRLIYIVRKKADVSQLSDLLNNCSEDMQQDGQEIEKIIKLALWCLHMDPNKRPSMSKVVNILKGAVNLDFNNEHDLLSSPMGGIVTKEAITQVSDCLLSGPR